MCIRDSPKEVQEFIAHVSANFRAIDSFPEPFFDRAALPLPKPGKSALVTGLVIAGFGAMTIVFALVAVQESDAIVVVAVGALGLLVGGILAAIGFAKTKAK